MNSKTLGKQKKCPQLESLCILGARDFSSAVSGFCLVFIVTRASPLVASAYGRRCVGLQPTPEIPAAREKNLWYPGWSLWGTLSKNFQCKSCIKAKSLNGVLAAISSTVCLFFFLTFQTFIKYCTALHTNVTWHCMILHYNELQIHYITLHYEPDYELKR